ncbi:hypothetical protein DFH27DRAFT_487022 [Peziza echinospora]|nr:hypothetical protein DFH27DRAFT_487022 [Peziza echinospora]
MAHPNSSTPTVDIMNDPAYAPRKSSTEAGNEIDHCRICRSESTIDEPLFHPCKCSGSIKFVHQDCLMEWLQHSQKKYCELCKTPFQFTKLYHPEMPKNLPPLLFLSRASKHLASTIMLWLRFLLVAFVWLGILPWVVRWMWRFWFWLGDGGWAWWRRKPDFLDPLFTDNNTFADNTSSIVVTNETAIGGETGAAEWTNGSIFTNITRSATLNKIFLDTLEGQILTALIVVTFVMIFLIREWVVQQQPDLAGDVVGLDNLVDMEQIPEPLGDVINEEEVEEEPEQRNPGIDPEILDLAYGRLQEIETNAAEGDQEEAPAQQSNTAGRPRVYAPLRKRRNFALVDEATDSERTIATGSAFNGPGIVLGSSSGIARSSSFNLDSMNNRRPPANREVMSQPMDIRRKLEEGQYISTGLPRIRTIGRGETLDDDSDWEDEEEEGADSTNNAAKKNSEPASSYSAFSTSLSPVNFSDSPGPAEKGIFPLELRPSSTPPSWGKLSEPAQTNLYSVQGSNIFAWDSARKPMFDFGAKDNNLSSSSLDTPVFSQPLSTSNWRGDIAAFQSENLWDNSASEKGKGKEKADTTESSPPNLQTVSKLATVTNEPEQTRLADLSREIIQKLEHNNNQWMWDESTGSLDDENVGYDLQSPNEGSKLDDQAPRPPTTAMPEPVPTAVPVDTTTPAPAPVPAPVVEELRNEIIPLPVRNLPAGDDIDTDDEDNDEWDEAQNAGQQIRVGGVAEDVQDEADDFDGIMELIGMRGPLYGLGQNAAISIILISGAVMFGVAVPYIWGRILLTIIAHPILFTVVIPWNLAVYCANLIIDSGIYLACNVMFAADFTGRLILRALPRFAEFGYDTTFSNLMRNHANDGWKRVAKKLTKLAMVVASDRTSMEGMSLITSHPETSHAWLASRQPWARLTLAMSWVTEKLSLSVNVTTSATQSLQNLQTANHNQTASAVVHDTFKKLIEVWREPLAMDRNTSYIIPIASEAEEALVEFSNSASWSAADRFIAVLAGYVLFTMVGAYYLSKYKSQPGSYRRHLEKTSIELLQQAGGVMKVILIIGIEMFVFPLYCGLLLDVALLPLFENATVLSRIQFTRDHLFTSTFVHWFVGTCYMFHFALFVSMCRKIMRPGVLYFIRDPDDPTLHPVKDVLERPVMLQLRKIAFSALIYGFLVLVCLGGVVWFLYSQCKGVLPIHWSSNEPVLEFPVDLLFYNFFMPVAVQFFKPSEALQKMYAWWFRKCARWLRLTSFMFGDRRNDEEGRTVRNTWVAALLLKPSDPDQPLNPKEENSADVSKQETYFLRDGRFVRAPADDSVRRPKGQTVFIPVNEANERVDGQSDPEDGDTGPNSPNFKLVYIPPHFKSRIFLVVLSIWLFAAVTGVGITIGPLLLGRAILETLVPQDLRMNDVYAFSIGIYIIGATLYLGSKYQAFVEWFEGARASLHNPGKAQLAVRKHLWRAIKVSYIFAAFGLVLPTLLALMIEFYVIIPMHTYFTQGEVHVIHVIQDWTLGVLYVKMMGNMLLLDPESPWARALRGIVARGYLDPDVRLATRCFIFPATLIMTSALLVPLGLAFLATKTILQDASPSTLSKTYRYSYPMVFILLVFLAFAYFFKIMVDKWKQNVRDEVYLIGEKLHNHGERRPPASQKFVASRAQTEPLLLEPNGAGETAIPGPAGAEEAVAPVQT